MVIRVKIIERPTTTGSTRKKPSTSSKNRGHDMILHQRRTLPLRYPGGQQSLLTMRTTREDHAPHHTLQVNSKVPTLDSTRTRSKSPPRRLSSRKLSLRHDVGNPAGRRRRRSRSIGYNKSRRFPLHNYEHGRSKSPSRRSTGAAAAAPPAPRIPPQKKTEYVPLDLKTLKIEPSSSSLRSSSSSKTKASLLQHGRTTGPPLSSENSSTTNKNSNNSVSSVCLDDRDDRVSSSSSSSRLGRDQQSCLSNKTSGDPSRHALASRPATPNISKYASYSQPKGGNKNQRRIGTLQSRSYNHQRKRTSSNGRVVKSRVVLRRSLSPTTRDRRRVPKDDKDPLANSERRSKSERASRTLVGLLGGQGSSYLASRPNSLDQELVWSSNQNQHQEKSEHGTRRCWGLKSWTSKLKRNNNTMPDSQNDDETRDLSEREADSDRGDGDLGNDLERTGKQIQFLSNVANMFPSFDGIDDYEDETNDDHKLFAIIKATERLERKLEDIGDPNSPSMTPNEIRELMSSLSTMREQAAQMARHAPPPMSCLSAGPVIEPKEGHVDSSSWLDTLSKAMFGRREWDANVMTQYLRDFYPRT